MNIVHDQSVESFLDALASKSPTPGGGSAVAVLGAMGAALVSMVANLTIGKKNYEAVEAEMLDALQAANQLREHILSLVAADIAAFDQVMAAYGLPKETEARSCPAVRLYSSGSRPRRRFPWLAQSYAGKSFC